MQTNYSKVMIDLVYQIRRRLPQADRLAIKLASEELPLNLAKQFHNSDDNVLKALIKEFLTQAGSEHKALLDSPLNGLSIAQVRQDQMASTGYAPPRNRQVIYRGQVVNG